MMKPYEQLTRLGRLRRIRRIAVSALDAYGLDGAEMRCFYSAGNVLYRVIDREQRLSSAYGDLFLPDQYLLRVLAPGWQPHQAIELELDWLAAMRREADLPVPEPISRMDGALLSVIAAPGVPEPRSCALLRWVKGRLLGNDGLLYHYQEQGRLMGRMHAFTRQWQTGRMDDSEKRHYDWDGLFMNDPEIGLQPGQCWKYLPADWKEPFETTAEEFRALEVEWGRTSDVYGLIHADMGLDANLLFWHGDPRPIDFDGSGFGYWMYDLAVAVAHMIGKPEHELYWEALLDGYSEHSRLPSDQIAKFDLFTAAFYVYFILWIVGVDHLRPNWLDMETEELMYRGAAFIKRFVEGG